MLRVTYSADVIHANKIVRFDPFQNSIPCWLMRVLPQLPPERVITVTLDHIKEKERMAIKTVAVQQAPERFFKRGVITSKQDYNDAINWLRNAKPGEAAIITMTPTDWEGVEKPETKFGFTLRRYFESKKLDVTAYQSGPMEVTIRKATALDKQHRGPKAKK